MVAGSQAGPGEWGSKPWCDGPSHWPGNRDNGWSSGLSLGPRRGSALHWPEPRTLLSSQVLGFSAHLWLWGMALSFGSAHNVTCQTCPHPAGGCRAPGGVTLPLLPPSPAPSISSSSPFSPPVPADRVFHRHLPRQCPRDARLTCGAWIAGGPWAGWSTGSTAEVTAGAGFSPAAAASSSLTNASAPLGLCL